MNWGNKLLLVFLGFSALMSYMVYRCIETPVNLVNPEYYKDELAYQDIINATKNADSLNGKVTFKQQSNAIIMQFPPDLKNHPLKGSILFYCSYNIANDRNVKIDVDSTAMQEINIQNFTAGRYIVKVDWKDNEKHYYTEQPFLINALR